ncbi:MAG: BsaA family SipW-dependent biofilm matrix protein, partial [Oscillospiraceae bacterium]|nr:BsaA family SipW-dependent biofilm matrix protein [Oscillospiraceae bacterium]
MTAKKKRSSRDTRILIGALLIAGVIAGGSTFAWFTSKDEVTNRLSASADYNVSIAEDFTPPEEWVPGQTINKDVGAVNTGNIDALVRTHLEGAMNILSETAVASEIDIKAGFGSTTLTDVTDADLIALGLTKKGTSGNFYRTLSTVERSNANLAGT